MRISDWSSGLCSSAPRNRRFCLTNNRLDDRLGLRVFGSENARIPRGVWSLGLASYEPRKDSQLGFDWLIHFPSPTLDQVFRSQLPRPGVRSEEHTSELQSLMRISYAVFGLTKKTTRTHDIISSTL